MDHASRSAFEPSSVSPYGPARNAKPTSTAQGSNSQPAEDLKRNARNVAGAL
jgi:hypothetical protein